MKMLPKVVAVVCLTISVGCPGQTPETPAGRASTATSQESRLEVFPPLGPEKTSPLRQAGRLRCPTFLYHSEEDDRIAIADSETFVEALKKTNPRVTFVRGRRGDHYESMIREGVPKGIAWLQGLAAR